MADTPDSNTGTQNTVTPAATTPAAVKPAATASMQKQAEPVYSADEWAAASRAKFNTPPEVVRAALKLAGKAEATAKEAESAVKAFLTREVK